MKPDKRVFLAATNDPAADTKRAHELVFDGGEDNYGTWRIVPLGADLTTPVTGKYERAYGYFVEFWYERLDEEPEFVP